MSYIIRAGCRAGPVDLKADTQGTLEAMSPWPPVPPGAVNQACRPKPTSTPPASSEDDNRWTVVAVVAENPSTRR